MPKTAILLIVLIITGAVYANSLNGAFQFDDFAVTAWLEGNMTPFVAREMGIYHRPLPYLTYWLNFLIGGGNPLIFHVTNLGVHLVGVALVFLIVEHLLLVNSANVGTTLLPPSTYAAAFGALIFGVHPFFSSSVSYVYARGSMMAAVFVFAAILAALKMSSRWKYAVVPGLLLCGVLSKEEALIAPALFLGYAVIHRQKKAAVLLTVAMVCGLAAVMVLAPQVQTIANTGWYDNIKPAPDLILNYGAWPTVGEHLRGILSGYVFHTLGNLALPLWLTPDPSMVFDWRWIAALAVILAMAALALSERIPVDIRMASWALLCCPILGALVILVAEPLFEYRAYSMGLGVAILAGAIWIRLQRLTLAPVLACWILSALAVGTVQRNQVWSNTVDLWADANKKDPAKKRAVLNLSAALLKQQRDLEAERVLLDSLVIHPHGFKAAHVNLAAVYIENRKFDAAEFHARLGTPVPLAYTYVAITQAQGGHFEDALANVETTIELDPLMVYARSVRLGILKEMGRWTEELTALETAVAEHPKDLMAHATLSVAYRMSGFNEGADKHSEISKQLAKEND